MRSSLVLRARILSGGFIALSLLLVFRLYMVQIVKGDEYREKAISQYVEANTDTENRHSIFFTDKEGSLVVAAVMQSGWRIAIRPDDVGDPRSLLSSLQAITPIDSERFAAAISRKGDPYEEIAFRLRDEDAIKIRALKLSGVMLVRDQWRFYPAHELASHAVGFVGYQGDSKVGVYGLERSYQDTLSISSSGLYVNPFAEIFSNVGVLLGSDPTAHAGSVITSIEPKVQQDIEATLDSVVKTYSPKLAGAIVMDPHTGEILAIGVRPAFDPNSYNTVSDIAIFSNPLVEGSYEMGSIMKPLTMAVGIDSGAVTPTTKYNDTGCITKSGKKICNFDLKERGVVDMQQVLSQSLNVGASYVADKIGHEEFAKYIHAFELGERTGIDLPAEAIGNIAAIDNGSDLDYASAAFGQGIAVTPLEMTRALAALANNGVLPSPHIVTAIKYESGIVRSLEPPPGPQVIKPETAATVTNMLIEVFDKALLDGSLREEHYSLAAKTGTAQIAIPGGGGYYTDRYLHSFFGYLPAHEPRFIVFLFAVEPHGAQFASATLAQPFMDIAKFLINYYDIPPDR